MTKNFKPTIVNPDKIEICLDSLYYKMLHIKSNFEKPTSVKVSQISSIIFFDWYSGDSYIATSTECLDGKFHINGLGKELTIK